MEVIRNFNGLVCLQIYATVEKIGHAVVIFRTSDKKLLRLDNGHLHLIPNVSFSFVHI